jgi:ribosomal protein S18 acetylase RimI-like enzyme
LLSGFDSTLLSRVEDAGLNASAPPQQLWLDGWLLRFNAGKAKRARCINALAPGRLPVVDKLQQAQQVYTRAGLPMVVRITPFTQPASLDATLADLGFTVLDDTRVMVCPALTAAAPQGSDPVDPVSAGGRVWPCKALAADDFAQAVGALRGTPMDQRLAHAQRLLQSPVPYHGYVLGADEPMDGLDPGQVAACGQFAQEDELVGLYDVYTHPQLRRQGLARALCERLLSLAISQGAKTAYLQVESDNHAARRIYSRMGFVDAYGYHYRQAP